MECSAITNSRVKCITMHCKAVHCSELNCSSGNYDTIIPGLGQVYSTTEATVSTVRPDVFLDHFRVIGCHFTVADIHTIFSVVLVVKCRIFVTAFVHEPFQNVRENPTDCLVLVFVNVGRDFPPVDLK